MRNIARTALFAGTAAALVALTAVSAREGEGDPDVGRGGDQASESWFSAEPLPPGDAFVGEPGDEATPSAAPDDAAIPSVDDPLTPASGEAVDEGILLEDVMPGDFISPEDLPPPDVLLEDASGAEDVLLESARDGAEDILLEPARDGAADGAVGAALDADGAPGEAREVLREPEPERVIAPEANVAGGVTCYDGAAPCVVDATGQVFRVLPRSLTAIYSGPADDAAVVSNEVRPFQPTLVFDRRDLDFSNAAAPEGWYQVGYTPDLPVGWMRARDVVEWRQALLLAYTHPGAGVTARAPVLMFETHDDVEAVVTAPDRRDRARALLDDVRAGRRPTGVIARESDNFLDIDEQLYFLPVIQWRREDLFEEDSLYLQVFAATPGERAVEGEGTLLDDTVLARGGDPDEGPPEGPVFVDVKFVIDMTGSMQPYIDSVTDGIASVVEELESATGENAQVRYGLVGYRDNPDFTPDLEWASNDFTPELVDGAAMLDILRNDGAPLAAQTSSDEWAEDVFAGVDTAINGSWSSDNSIRLVILIGDASAHEPGTARDNKSTTGYTAESLRSLVDAANAYVMAVHLRDDVAASDWDTAVRQFGALARNPDGERFLYQTDAYNEGDIERVFAQFVDDITNTVLPAAEAGAGGLEVLLEEDAFETAASSVPAPETSTAPEASTADEGIEMARGLLRAALVDYLGDETTPQRDFLSWVHDYDLADPTRPAFNVRVLVNREQLDTILRRTEAIQQASAIAIGARVDFYEQLRSVAARSSLGVDVAADDTLGDQDFLPQWVEALPYRSAVLGMSPDMFANMSPNEQIQFERALLGKVTAMREILGNADLWIRLDENDPDLFEVTALQISLLP